MTAIRRIGEFGRKRQIKRDGRRSSVAALAEWLARNLPPGVLDRDRMIEALALAASARGRPGVEMIEAAVLWVGSNLPDSSKRSRALLQGCLWILPEASRLRLWVGTLLLHLEAYYQAQRYFPGALESAAVQN
jgi:hypothetical protein